MPHLDLTLFGAFQAHLSGEPLANFHSVKVQGLLAYLALEAARPHARETLMALFWPDDAPPSAQQSMRQALYTLRRALGESGNQPGASFLLVTRQTVQFNATANYALDVQTFLHHLDQGELEQAVTLYQAELLAGLATDSAPFEEWLLNRREYLHNLALDALTHLTEDALADGDAAKARTYAQRQLALEPWREEAHQQLIKALAAAGERSAALAQYETCKRLLAQELGVEPAAATTALFESIRTGALARQALSPFGGQAKDYFRHDLGEMPAVPLFVGRDSELAALKRALTLHACRLAVVTGMGGMGKTALTVKLTQGFAAPDSTTGAQPTVAEQPFARIIWRSLLNAPPLDKILQDWLQILSAGELDELPDRLDRRFELLFRQLSRQRCLLILDNVESIMASEAGQAGTFRSGYEVYDQLLRRMGESDHRSCLVLTSRELPREVARLERDFAVAPPENTTGAVPPLAPIYVLQLAGLSTTAGQEVLQVLGLRGASVNGAQAAATSAAALIARYSGNPLALKLVTETISELYDGDVAEFLAEEGAIFEDIGNVLDQQFARLSPLERAILIWLAVEREPIARQELAEHLVQLGSRRLFLEAVNSLQRRSLLERTGERFTLQNVVIEYTTELLIDAVCEEINRGDFRLETIPTLTRHALVLAHAKEHIRESQIRLIVRPISERLIARHGQLGLERRLQQVLAALRAAAP